MWIPSCSKASVYLTSVMSNRESGDGFSDILIRIEDEDVGIVIEVKYASDGNLEKECENELGREKNTMEKNISVKLLRNPGRWG